MPLNRVVENVTAIDLCGRIVVKVRVTAKEFEMAVRQTNFHIPFGKIGMVNALW